jgi:hypothetical protein
MHHDETKSSSPKGELLLCKTPDGKIEIKIKSEEGREFLSLHQITDFFETDKTYIVYM